MFTSRLMGAAFVACGVSECIEGPGEHPTAVPVAPKISPGHGQASNIQVVSQYQQASFLGL